MQTKPRTFVRAWEGLSGHLLPQCCQVHKCRGNGMEQIQFNWSQLDRSEGNLEDACSLGGYEARESA